MTTHRRHSRLRWAARLAAGLVVLVAAVVVALAAAVAAGPAASADHACCPDGMAAEAHCAGGAAMHASPMAAAHGCGCHIMPERQPDSAKAFAVTGTTVAVSAAVAPQANPQIDLPLAREPDAAQVRLHLGFRPALPSLHLLHGVLLC